MQAYTNSFIIHPRSIKIKNIALSRI